MMTKKIVIIGASGHGKVIADIAKLNGYTEIVFLDDDLSRKKCGEYSVVGKSSDAPNYPTYDFIIGIGNAKIRQLIQQKLESMQLRLAVLIHPAAIVAEDVKVSAGTVVMAGSVINPGTVIGKGCIINTCSSVDHDCQISDYVHISVGAHIAGTVYIGERTWIGAGGIVSNNISICGDCMVGAGAVIVRNIEESGTYVGVPAKKVK